MKVFKGERFVMSEVPLYTPFLSRKGKRRLSGRVPRCWRESLPGNLAHKKQPPRWDLHRALSIVQLQGPGGGLLLMSEVPLYTPYLPRKGTRRLSGGVPRFWRGSLHGLPLSQGGTLP